jgi:hypothetical protein
MVGLDPTTQTSPPWTRSGDGYDERKKLLRWHESRHARLKQTNQLGVHEFILIRNIKANHTFVFKKFPKFFGELVAMCFFHHKNDICPLKLFCRKLLFRVRIQACGIRFHIEPSGKDVFRRWAAKFVGAANKEKPFHSCILAMKLFVVHLLRQGLHHASSTWSCLTRPPRLRACTYN